MIVTKTSPRVLAGCISLLATALALAVSAPVLAEKSDREKPINFSAADGNFDYEKRTGALKGNVIITQGTITIKADRIEFKQNQDNSMSAMAYGNPISFRQKQDGKDEYYEGSALRADYDGQKELLQLFDRAVLKRGTDEIRSNYISYNAATEFFKAEGRGDAAAAQDELGRTDRVRGVFSPKSEGAPGKNNVKGSDRKVAPGLTLKPSEELQPK